MRLLNGADGICLAADEAGSGDGSVLLLHGGGQTRHAWRKTAAAVAARGWQTSAVDLRGHGDSSWPPDGDYSLSAFADDVRAVVSGLPTPVVLVGASLGGLAGLLAAGEPPRAPIAALVLVDVAPVVELEGAQRIVSFMAEHMGGFDSLEAASEAIRRYNPSRGVDSPDGLRRNLRETSDGTWVWHWDPRFLTANVDSVTSMLDRPRLERAARAVTIPTLLVRGAQSDLLSERGVDEFSRLVPHARIARVERAGHMVVGDENDPFNAAILDFIQDLRDPSSALRWEG